jgi:hypothetical protein
MRRSFVDIWQRKGASGGEQQAHAQQQQQQQQQQQAQPPGSSRPPSRAASPYRHCASKSATRLDVIDPQSQTGSGCQSDVAARCRPGLAWAIFFVFLAWPFLRYSNIVPGFVWRVAVVAGGCFDCNHHSARLPHADATAHMRPISTPPPRNTGGRSGDAGSPPADLQAVG